MHDAFVEGTQIICKLAGQTKEDTHAPRMKLDSAQNVDKVLIVYYIYIYIYIDMGAKNSQRLPQKRNFGALAWSHLYKQTNIHAGLGATGTTGKSFRVVSCMRAEGICL